MTSKTTCATLAALLLAASPLAYTAANAQAKPPAKPPISSDVAKALNEVQKDVTAKKFPEAATALQGAQTAAKTNYEKLKVNQFTMVVDLNTGNEAGAIAAAQAAADTPAADIPDDEKLDLYSNAAALSLNGKQYDKAATYAKLMMALNPPDARNQEIIGKSLYAAGDPAATSFYQKQVDAAVAAGKTPSRDSVTMVLNAQIKAKDEPGAEKTLEQSVGWYNDPKDWQQIIDITMSTPGIRDVDAVILGRLLFLCGAPVSKENADLVGQTAARLTMYGDAQMAVSKGATVQLEAARVNTDKTTMPQQIKLGATAPGAYNLKLSEALYGYGMYPEAETAARLALTKGGVDNSEAQMVIGMSLAGEGKYADAAAAFGQVTGGSPATPRIARLWGIYAKQKAAPAATAAAQ